MALSTQAWRPEFNPPNGHQDVSREPAAYSCPLALTGELWYLSLPTLSGAHSLPLIITDFFLLLPFKAKVSLAGCFSEVKVETRGWCDLIVQ